MTAYAGERRVTSVTRKGVSTASEDLASIFVPANRQIEVYRMVVMSRTAPGAGTTVTLVDNAGSAITGFAAIAIGTTTGVIKDALTAPLVLPVLTVDTTYRIRAGATTYGASTDVTIELHTSESGYV